MFLKFCKGVSPQLLPHEKGSVYYGQVNAFSSLTSVQCEPNLWIQKCYLRKWATLYPPHLFGEGQAISTNTTFFKRFGRDHLTHIAQHFPCDNHNGTPEKGSSPQAHITCNIHPNLLLSLGTQWHWYPWHNCEIHLISSALRGPINIPPTSITRKATY